MQFVDGRSVTDLPRQELTSIGAHQSAGPSASSILLLANRFLASDEQRNNSF